MILFPPPRTNPQAAEDYNQQAGSHEQYIKRRGRTPHPRTLVDVHEQALHRIWESEKLNADFVGDAGDGRCNEREQQRHADEAVSAA